MKIVVAPDSFKESLSASDVAARIESGVKKVLPEAFVTCIPLADGGEGTVESIVYATDGKIIHTPSLDPLGREIQSFYGVMGNGFTAVIEMAAASGLELLKPEERNPMITSTYGTGLLLKNAIENGYKEIIIGIGGSATNDGGVGMAMALGYRFLDEKGNEIGQGGGNLNNLANIDDCNINTIIKDVRITVASDVRNPLLGPQGASFVFGPQKGATDLMVEQLDLNLRHLARITSKFLGRDLSQVEGAGAAGGLGFGMMAFLGATLRPGFGIIKDVTQLEKHIGSADLVITGEGKIDHQSIYGKTVYGIGKIARKYNVPVIALCGSIGEGIEVLHNHGITACFSILDRPLSLRGSIEETGELLEKKTIQLIRLIKTIF
jgi:glycerate 2-kinase